MVPLVTEISIHPVSCENEVNPDLVTPLGEDGFQPYVFWAKRTHDRRDRCAAACSIMPKYVHGVVVEASGEEGHDVVVTSEIKAHSDAIAEYEPRILTILSKS